MAGTSDAKIQENALMDFDSAIRTLHSARSLFILLLVISLLFNITAFFAVTNGQVLDTAATVEKAIASPSDEDSPHTESVTEAAEEIAPWKTTLELGLPLAQFIGLVSCILLAICYLAGANICISGRMGGAGGCLSAFFWSLFLLAILFPWNQWMEVAPIPGVFVTLADLVQANDIRGDLHTHLTKGLYYMRYVGYPIIAMLVLLVANGRFSRGTQIVLLQIDHRLGQNAH